MKKIMILTICFLMGLGSVIPVLAESDADFAADEGKYTQLCARPTSDLTTGEQETCKQFVQYMSNKNADLRDQLAEIEKKRAEISANIKEYAKKIEGYDAEIKKLGTEIATLNEQISVKQEEIRVKEEEIATNEKEVEILKQKIKDRMVASQSSMKLNQYLDIIMGAKDFNDLIRRTNGINDITNHDEQVRISLKELIEQLTADKAALEVIRQELEVDKAAIVEKQNQIIVIKHTAEIAKAEYMKQEADLEAEGNRIAGNLEAIKKALAEIANSVDGLPSSSGFVRPISGGRISAGTWSYTAGGTHLGADFAVGSGSTVRAAANGVVIKSVDGCGWGGLGNQCGSAQGGSSGGGNQIYLLSKIDGVLYAIKYLHLLQGSPIAQNTIVMGGDYIGQVGSSGNSSGPHCHVEVFKLGTMSASEYIASWNGDLSFGAGWGTPALSNTCDKRGGAAPCRVRPETVFN